MARNNYRIHKRPASNIELRRGRYYAVMGVPKDLQQKLGSNGKRKFRFVASLETDSLTKAKERVGTHLARWRAELAEARGEPNDDDAAFYRRALARAKSDRERDNIKESIQLAADDIAYANMDWDRHQRPSQVPEASDFYNRATGSKVVFAARVDEWLAQSNVTDKTKAMQRSDVMRFANEFETVEQIERLAVQHWIIGLGVKPKTVLRVLSALRGYWKYLQGLEEAPRDASPFDGIELPRAPRVRTDERLPFEARDIPYLIQSAGKDETLRDLIELAAYTGCRIEELCALELKNVATDHLKITDSKTAAGVREVPIHMAIKSTVKRLTKASEDGYLLSGLKSNKYGYRSDAIGKRFGRLKTQLRYERRYVFHSIRKTVATQLENAGVPENVAADLLGHEKNTMTYGLYSGGSTLAVKAKALAKVRY